MEQAAEIVHDEITDMLTDDAIHGVGYFNDETQKFIHISGDLNQRYDEKVFADILENAFLDVWGQLLRRKCMLRRFTQQLGCTTSTLIQ